MDAVFRHGYPAVILIGALAAWSFADSTNRGWNFSHPSFPTDWQLTATQTQSCRSPMLIAQSNIESRATELEGL